MKKRETKYKLFLEGFQTSFDLLGCGFEKNYGRNNINNSWYNVGIYFSTGFEKFSEQDKNDEKIEDVKKLQLF